MRQANVRGENYNRRGALRRNDELKSNICLSVMRQVQHWDFRGSHNRICILRDGVRFDRDCDVMGISLYILFNRESNQSFGDHMSAPMNCRHCNHYLVTHGFNLLNQVYFCVHDDCEFYGVLVVFPVPSRVPDIAAHASIGGTSWSRPSRKSIGLISASTDARYAAQTSRQDLTPPPKCLSANAVSKSHKRGISNYAQNLPRTGSTTK